MKVLVWIVMAQNAMIHTYAYRNLRRVLLCFGQAAENLLWKFPYP